MSRFDFDRALGRSGFVLTDRDTQTSVDVSEENARDLRNQLLLFFPLASPDLRRDAFVQAALQGVVANPRFFERAGEMVDYAVKLADMAIVALARPTRP